MILFGLMSTGMEGFGRFSNCLISTGAKWAGAG